MPSPESKPQIPLSALVRMAGRVLQETVKHPRMYSGVKWDLETKSVNVRRFKEAPEIK